MNKNLRISLIISVIVAVLGFISWQVWLYVTHGTLQITTSPTDAIVTIDKTQKAQAGYISLAAGKHTVEVSHANFKSSSFSITITANKTLTRDESLNFIDVANATSWSEQNPDQASQREALAGKSITNRGGKLMVDHPILNRLPYTSSSYRIDFGKSEKHPDDPNAVTLYIYTGDADAKNKANTWMKSQGFNPSDYEIIYSGYDDPTAVND